ncbi:hypothetical protein [Streptomyces graminilatus]|uniref:hypothetical protein n=1 Tax=Streptomyces graminilatus TaxID=1464070 RepID=UPI0006E1E98C|nr:hypothetical protein [Streptomyces graminilatus]
MAIPKRGTPEYKWHLAGALDEAEARREGRSKDALDVRSYVDAIAKHHRDHDHVDIALDVFSAFALVGQPLRARLRFALWVLRDGKGRARRRPRR